ncbi:hypothetical protein P3H15_48250 [Rhodococcus sp. T2V]|uniref:hypothetical protein n=1 Tax=Rhodococcus sp. T2V TaxID=3034164 RepID=UPI0023E2A0A5|nr:hypothetical protein [Rhodococcus sp. T2V]MDF3312738.1 hypothetical protein [Rhodococcus sp. T2V]
MLLTDLLDLPVHDGDDHRVGWVIDLRFHIPDNTHDGGGENDQPIPPPELVGVLISPRRRGSYLGFERTDVRSPRLLAGLIRWRHRATFLVAWTDVDRVLAGAVVLHEHYQRHSPLLTR